MTQENRAEMLASLLELSKHCPLYPANPRNCPLYGLRKLNMRQRWEWINALTDEDLVYLASYHHVCLKIKLEEASVSQACKTDKRLVACSQRKSSRPASPAAWSRT